MWHKGCRIQNKFIKIYIHPNLDYILFFAKLAYVIANGKITSRLAHVSPAKCPWVVLSICKC